MKKVLSILFALLILFSGTHLTIATHFCHNILVASRISFSGKPAFCGMEEHTDQKATYGLSVHHDCCTDHLSFFTITHFYSPSSFHFKASAPQLLKNCISTENPSHILFAQLSIFSTNTSPPGILRESAVSLPGICVLRI
jgi:hypothetical protein